MICALMFFISNDYVKKKKMIIITAENDFCSDDYHKHSIRNKMFKVIHDIMEHWYHL